MTKVLLGLDGSALAREAAARGLTMLAPPREVTALTVARVPVAATLSAPTVAGDLPAPLSEMQLTDITERAATEARADVAALGIDAEIEVVIGEPGRELCRVAAEGGYDVIVVGSHGSGAIKRVLLGSVSDHVVHHAPCPVLVIHHAKDS